MADVRQRTTIGNLFRYGLRFLGVTGLFAAVFALGYYFSTHDAPNTWAEARGSVEAAVERKQTLDDRLLIVGAAGAALAAAWLALELLMGLATATGRRTAAGGNIYAQIGLAAAVFIILNAIAFRNYNRYDLTRNQAFTLPPGLVRELQTLNNESPTDVVVLQLHKTAIARGLDPDNVDKAAERKIVEKVNDLVEQLRELGPRLKVSVLDRQDETFGDSVDKLPAPLRRAIRSAPEDSIFFHANGRVRRMSFSDFYRVDKTASQTAQKVPTPDGGMEVRVRSTNLVLLPQGREQFVRRILSLEQRTPKIGLLAIHPELSTRESSDMISAMGLRKSLEANGFEVLDVLIKKWGGRGGPTPAALTYEENELERMESRSTQIAATIQNLSMQKEAMAEAAKRAETQPLTDLNRLYSRMLRRSITTEDDRKFFINVLAANMELMDEAIDELKPELDKAETKYRELLGNERAGEGRRQTDVKEKLQRIVSDCDLLIIPRLTTLNLQKSEVISPSFYTMPKEQADVIRGFIASGKPVLACLGPSKIDVGRGPLDDTDELEKLFEQLGFELSPMTVVTDEEARAAAERSGESLGGASDLPPLVLDFETPSGTRPNPVREAYRVAARAVDGDLMLARSGPRIIGVSPRAARTSPFAATILQSVRESWAESRPVPEGEYVPKYEPAKIDDPKRGTPEEERRGPFGIAAALETRVPAEWFDESLLAARTAAGVGAAAGGLGLSATTLLLEPEVFAAPNSLPERPLVRIVVYGHGGLFVGETLTTAQEQLLLHTINWQLKREELLPRDAPPSQRWQFPRVEMSESRKRLWQFGTFLGLPMLCAYAGLIVLMTRRMR